MKQHLQPIVLFNLQTDLFKYYFMLHLFIYHYAMISFIIFASKDHMHLDFYLGLGLKDIYFNDWPYLYFQVVLLFRIPIHIHNRLI